MDTETTVPFFRQKRNLAALCVWSALLLCLIAGIIMNTVFFHAGSISKGTLQRRLFYAGLCFVMMSAVYVFEWIFRIRFPLFLELVLTVFAFMSLAGGTVFNLYSLIPFWDKVLHTLSGPMFSVVGLCFADLLLKDQPLGARKAVAYAAIAFFFALSVGYVWEIFEYTVDSVIPGYNNQRWAAGVVEELENGYFIVTDKRGTGLHDTMWDMICNCIGALVFLTPLLVVCLNKTERLNVFHTEVIKRKKKAESDESDDRAPNP